MNAPFLCAGADHLVVGLIVGWTTVGIAGTVLLDGSDVDLFRSQDFGPAYGDGEEVGVAEGDVGDGDLGWEMRWHLGQGSGNGAGNLNGRVGEGRAPNGAQGFVAHDELIANAEASANGEESLALTGFGTLAVANMERSGVSVARSEGGADAGVHAAREEDYGFGLRGQGLDAFHGWIPDEFVDLQPEASRDVVSQHPLGKFLRIQETVRGVAPARSVFAEGGREEHGVHAVG